MIACLFPDFMYRRMEMSLQFACYSPSMRFAFALNETFFVRLMLCMIV